MENEIWKDVIGYENRYKVSDYGNVKSLNYKNTGKEMLLCPSKDNGYLRVCLSNNGTKSIKIHQLVAMTFIDFDYKKKGLVVDHIDRNKHNNYLQNLRVVTPRENTSYIRGGISVLGVKKVWNRYHTSIRYNKKRIFIGSFESIEKCELAYKMALEIVNNRICVESNILKIKEKLIINNK